MIVGLEPAKSGWVHRAGHRIAWQEFGQGSRTILLMPTWSIVHTDFWRDQVPFLASRHRVITFDGLGNGASDRPEDPAVYGDLLVADDAVAVLDARQVGLATVIGASQGGVWALALAGRHPQRVDSAVFIAPNVPLAPGHPARVAAQAAFHDRLRQHEGWSKWNADYWRQNFGDFLAFFFSQCFTEPDSDLQIEHFLGMGRQTTPEVLLATAGDGTADLTAELAGRYAAALRCPALVIHGDRDAITPLARGQELARLSGAELIVMPGSGHEPHCRNPHGANQIIARFLERHHGRPST